MGTVVSVLCLLALCFCFQRTTGRLDSDCRACDYYVWVLEEYLCSINARLHLAEGASSFLVHKHP